jgi:hypothetical protein
MTLATVILVASCAVVMFAVGQTAVAELPQECSAYESIPLPTEAAKTPVPQAYPICASYRSYRGIGRPVNWFEARQCAWQERLAQKDHLAQREEEPIAWVVGGSLILADIYFNGAGVKRDTALALHFACESEQGMATLALQDLAKVKGSHRTDEPFEFCHYAATTITMNFCAGYEKQIMDDRRSRDFDSLGSSMTANQKVAFEKLLLAQKAYVKAHASEVYQGGTIRGTRTIGSQSSLDDLFHTQLVRFEHNRWPALSGNQVIMADAVLDREYEKKVQQIRTRSREDINDGAVTANHLSSVEETWKIYRDAWVEFAVLRYPAKVATIRAEITLDRYRLLKTIS